VNDDTNRTMDDALNCSLWRPVMQHSSDRIGALTAVLAKAHRLGAALTYARRYALFTLVGIAGEDDLDAPDLPTAAMSSEAQKKPLRPEQGATGLEELAIEPKPGRPVQMSNGRARAERSKPASLPPDASENLRHRLINELEQLIDPEALATWAQRALPLKNQLATTDAQAVEAAVAAKLSELGDATARPESDQANGHHGQSTSTEIEEVVSIGKPVRERDHLRFVAAQPCLVCGRTPSDAHHIKFAEQRAMERKVSDRFTVPICRLHHRKLHRRGDERAWWRHVRRHKLRRRLRATQIGRQGSTHSSTDVILARELPLSLIDSKITKRSQFVARRQNELVPANRGQPPQCAFEHGSCH
jgi:ERF superfamily